MQIVMEIFTGLQAGNPPHQPCHIETKVRQIVAADYMFNHHRKFMINLGQMAGTPW